MIPTAARVLQVHPDHSRLNQFARRLGGIFRIGTIPRFDVSGYRHMHSASDAADTSHHFLAWNALAVRITQRKSDARGGRCNRGEARFLEDAGAGHIPRVRQDEHARSAMELPELNRFVGLGFHNSSLSGQLPRAFSRMRSIKLGTCTTARPTVPRPIS